MMPIALKNNNEYYAIDNFLGGIDASTEASKIQRVEGPKIMNKFMSNMKKMGINRSDYKLFKTDSASAAVYLVDNTVGFCFVDADHAYISVTKDIETWWPKIKIGGYLAGHDFQNKDVKMAVTEFSKYKNLNIEIGGNCWSLKKERN